MLQCEGDILEILYFTINYDLRHLQLRLGVVTNNYILTNLLALFIVFLSFKVLKINSLRSGTLFLIIVGVFDIIQDSLRNICSDYPLDRFYSSDFCYPLKFEIPTFDNFLTKRCSWLSVLNLIFPGPVLLPPLRFQQKDQSLFFNGVFRLFMRKRDLDPDVDIRILFLAFAALRLLVYDRFLLFISL